MSQVTKFMKSLVVLLSIASAKAVEYVAGTCGEMKSIYRGSSCCPTQGGKASNPINTTEHAGCPDSSTGLAGPLPDPYSVAFAFDHIIHCDAVVDNGGIGSSGSVITRAEHYAHCVKIQAAADLGKTDSSNYLGTINWELCGALMPTKQFAWAMPSMDINSYATPPSMNEGADPSNANGINIPAGGCKLTVEYSAYLSSLHHEQLVAKQARTPGDLTPGETDYLNAWYTKEIGKQYAIARHCKIYEELPNSDPVLN